MTLSDPRIIRGMPIYATSMGLSESETPANNVAAMLRAIALQITTGGRIIIPQGRYRFSGPINVPTTWSGIYIEGEVQGSASVRQDPGTQLCFPGTDGFRVPWNTAINEQFQISRLHFVNTIGVLAYRTQTANFTIGDTITGGTSGATAVIVTDTDAGAKGKLTLSNINGEFLNGEAITGSLGGSAIASIFWEMAYDAQASNFTVGDVITGASSGATATISGNVDAGTTGTLTLYAITGTFQDNETITGSLGGSALVNGSVKGLSQYDTFAQPYAVKFTVDAGRVPPNYNYPQMIYFDELSVTGFKGMWLASRAAGYSDPASFFGTTVVSRIHLYRTDYSLHNQGCYFNLIHFDTMRNHVGGTLYNEGAGGFYHFRECHWEAAEARVIISPFSLETRVCFTNCGGEFNGTGTTFTSTAGTLTVGGPDGFIKLEAGVHTRTYQVILLGDNQVPGNFEYPPQLGRFIELWNYGPKIEIDALGCIIHTPATVDVCPPVYVAAPGNVRVSTYKVPWDVYAGAGSARTPCTQALAGKPSGANPGVSAQVTGKYPWIEADGAIFFGNSIPRSPAVTQTEQMFVLSYVADLKNGLSKIGSPVDIVASGTSTGYFDEALIADTGRYCTVVMLRIDSGNTLDTLFANPVGVGDRSIGYGSWHPVTNVAADQPLAVPRYTVGQSSLSLLHPAGHTLPMMVTVAGSATTTVNVRTTNNVSAACAVEVSTATGAVGEWRNGGRTVAASKSRAALANITTATSITFNAGDGDDPDMMKVDVVNGSATPTTAKVLITLR